METSLSCTMQMLICSGLELNWANVTAMNEVPSHPGFSYRTGESDSSWTVASESESRKSGVLS